MKNTTIFFAAVASAALLFTFTSCDKGDTPAPNYTLKIVDFEAAALDPDTGVLLDSYTEQELTFANKTNSDWGYWYGFAVSNNHDKETPGAGNQYSVYGSGGASNSSKFAVAYYSSWDGTTECSFPEGVEHEMEYAYITNSTYTALDTKQGSGFSQPFEAGDWFKVTATGYNAANIKTRSVDVVYLADFRNGKHYLCDTWLKADLSPLGKVNKIEFTCSSSDEGTPAYFCLDNVAYRVYE